jgi:hypothetical protein
MVTLNAAVDAPLHDMKAKLKEGDAVTLTTVAAM